MFKETTLKNWKIKQFFLISKFTNHLNTSYFQIYYIKIFFVKVYINNTYKNKNNDNL